MCLDEGRKDDAKGHFKEVKLLIEKCGYHRRDKELEDLAGKIRI